MNPYEMEYDYSTSKKVANVFYCKPYSSWQKHEIEVNHEYIRRVLPKKSDFSSLTNVQIKLLQDNINAIPRDSLNHKTPYDLTKEKFPELIDTLNLKYINSDDVTLNKKTFLVVTIMIDINQLLYKISIIIDYLECHGGHDFKIYTSHCYETDEQPDSDIVQYAKDVELLIIDIIEYYNIIC